jgi:hypothetical protein
MNVLLHGKAHLAQQENQQMQQQQQQQTPAPVDTGEGAPPAKPKKTNLKNAPIAGSKEVATT